MMQRTKTMLILMSSVWTACSEPAIRSTAPIVPASDARQNLQYSDGFYPDPDNPGYYYWDGQPASGDAAQAQILTARSFAKSPEITPGGWMTSGFVRATVSYLGDQSKIKIVYSVDKNGVPLYSNAETTKDWNWGPLTYSGGQQEDDYDHDLFLQDHCNVDVSAGGTAWAAKALPFGIRLNWLKPTSSTITLGAWRWGETEEPLEASQSHGKPCPPPPCDDPRTDEVEDCPPGYEPPGESNPNWSESGSEDRQIDQMDQLWRCWYKDKWWGETYLGRTWLYCERLA